MKTIKEMLVFKALATATVFSLLPVAKANLTQNDHRFGVMTHFAHGWDPKWVCSVGQTSILDVRDELYWQTVERERGRFSFPLEYDLYMGKLKRNHIEPLIVLSFENKNYDDGATPFTDDGIVAYTRYALEVLRHYGDQIKAVEVWNEYNGTFCKGPATQDRAGTYLRMLRAVYTAIKHERPDVLVVGGGTSGIPLPYWESLLSGGGLDFMDALSVHPYRYESAPEGLEQDIAALKNLVEKYNGGPKKPIWVSEIGWDTRLSVAPGDLAIDVNTQARFLVRAYALLISAGVERVYWYLLHDYEGLNMGLFRDGSEQTAKPASIAMKTLIQQLRGTNFIKTEATIAGLYSLVFSRASGEEVRVLWSTKPTEFAAQGALSAIDIFGNAVAIGDTFKLDDSPLFVTGSLLGLPKAPVASYNVLTDSVRDFSARQGGQGWSYGVFVGDSTTFIPLPNFTTTDWAQVWSGKFPYLALTARDQHPSKEDQNPVAAVRRWVSSVTGQVKVVGQFRCGTHGDGVGVSILVDGARRFRKLIGGKDGQPVVETFDFVQNVQPGSTIDFAVDPGPATDIDFDATSVSITINQESR